MNDLPRQFIDDPLVEEKTIERRPYQEKIARACCKENTLVCLPTGLGKTVIAALVTAERLRLYPDKKVVILAPTRPLVLQHYKTFQSLIQLDPSEFVTVTGRTPPNQRADYWSRKIIFSTPQVFMNDLIVGRVNVSEVALIVFDEAHRATGDYAYTFIAERYSQESNGLTLALTASPGSSRETIEAICRNLFVKSVEVRSVSSPDVEPFIGGIRVEWRKVALPKVFFEVRTHFEQFLREELRSAKEIGVIESASIEKVKLKEILQAVENLRKIMAGPNAPIEKLRRTSVGLYACIHAIRAIELLETQGFAALRSYFDHLEKRLKARAPASVKLILQDSRIKKALDVSDRASSDGLDHPKIDELAKIIHNAFAEGARRVIVFTNYRATASKLVAVLNNFEFGISAARLVGQVSKGEDRGLSQREQTNVLEDFRKGRYNVLVATQIGEEGLDIIECDQVVFYDTVPSAIRYIQRRGRTGRKGPGKVTILMSAGTRDEAYYWIARRKERMMAEALAQITSTTKDRQQPKLEEFMRRLSAVGPSDGKVTIIVDSREAGSPIIRELSKFDVKIDLETLKIGDFILSDRVAVEKKTAEDFTSSIIDGRLFTQVMNLKSTYQMPIVLVEGETLYSARDVRPEAVMGALVSVLIDYDVPIVWMRTPPETALFLFSVARREQLKERREPKIRVETKPETLSESQEYIIAGLPHIDRVLAKRLLKTFGSVERVFTVSEEELQKVEGIGKKISEKIRKIVSSKYEETS